jgi:hypothetical protein
MSTLDTAFAFLAEPLPSGSQWNVNAVLTCTSQSSVSASVAAASGGLTYTAPASFRDGRISGTTPAKVSFGMNSEFPSGQSFAPTVTLTKQESAIPVPEIPEYSIEVTGLPAGTVESAAAVDAASGVISGSEGTQLVTLALQFSTIPKIG